MEKIIIKQSDETGFIVFQGNKNSGHLGYDECLGLLASLIIPQDRRCLSWMKTKKEHERFKNYKK